MTKFYFWLHGWGFETLRMYLGRHACNSYVEQSTNWKQLKNGEKAINFSSKTIIQNQEMGSLQQTIKSCNGETVCTTLKYAQPSSIKWNPQTAFSTAARIYFTYIIKEKIKWNCHLKPFTVNPGNNSKIVKSLPFHMCNKACYFINRHGGKSRIRTPKCVLSLDKYSFVM